MRGHGSVRTAGRIVILFLRCYAMTLPNLWAEIHVARVYGMMSSIQFGRNISAESKCRTCSLEKESLSQSRCSSFDASLSNPCSVPIQPRPDTCCPVLNISCRIQVAKPIHLFPSSLRLFFKCSVKTLSRIEVPVDAHQLYERTCRRCFHISQHLLASAQPPSTTFQAPERESRFLPQQTLWLIPQTVSTRVRCRISLTSGI